MCHFIKLTVPAAADIPVLREIAKRHGRLFTHIPDDASGSVAPPGDQTYVTTATCDCGTGLAHRRFDAPEHDDAREEARLRREGWSEAKIQRRREQKTETAVRKAETAARSREQDIGAWQALLSDLLDAGVDHVGLLVHWVTDEARRGPVLPRERLVPETLASLDENVLYTFTRQAG